LPFEGTTAVSTALTFAFSSQTNDPDGPRAILLNLPPHLYTYNGKVS